MGLLGPNGAGKSTAMRVLLGLQRPTDGHARILGHEAGSPGFRDVTRKVGTIIESPPLYKNASALENLRIRAASIDVSLRDEDLKEILNRVGLAERADDQTGSFSLGMRQRAGIALALVGDPSIVVLDEPTNGLDPEGTVEVRDLVRSLPERGATALLCTHRLAEVEATCDYVVLLQGGHLITQGSLADVIASASKGGVTVDVAPEQLTDALRLIARPSTSACRARRSRSPPGSRRSSSACGCRRWISPPGRCSARSRPSPGGRTSCRRSSV